MAEVRNNSGQQAQSEMELQSKEGFFFGKTILYLSAKANFLKVVSSIPRHQVITAALLRN